MLKRGILIIFLFLCIPNFHFAFAYDDQGSVAVKGTVPAKSDSLEIAFDASNATSFNSHKSLTYTITYGSTLESSTPLTIEAQWYKGTIEDAPTATVDVLEYTNGTITDAYGTTPGVVDLVRQTITWTIPSFPASTRNQKVSFELQTTENYTGAKKVSFPVAVRIINPATTADVAVSRTYLYEAPKVTPTPTPTSAPDSVATASAITSTPFQINAVTISSITQSSASVRVVTNLARKLTLTFGTTSNELENAVSDDRETTEHDFTLTNLVPSTTYYFRMTRTKRDGSQGISEIYSLKTAQASSDTNSPLKEPQSLSIAQDGGILLTPTSDGAEKNAVVAASGSVLNLQFMIPTAKSIKTVKILIRPKVLGISTQESSVYQSQSTTATEVGDSIYVGKVQLPPTKGRYDIFVSMEDVLGNVREEKLATVNVVQPMRTIDTQGKAIEGVSILLSRFIEKAQTYEILPNTATSIKNPVVSDIDGIVKLNVFPGKYKGIATALGYKDQEIFFLITSKGQDDLPQIVMVSENTGVIGSLEKQALNLRKANNRVLTSLSEIADSREFFLAAASFAVLVLPILTWASISIRLKIPFLWAPLFLVRRLLEFFTQVRRVHYIGGYVTEGISFHALPLARVDLYATDKKSILRSTWTSELGEFYFNDIPAASSYIICIRKQGYVHIEEKIKATDSHEHQLFQLKKKNLSLFDKSTSIAGFIALRLGKFSLEFLLFFSFLLSLYLLSTLNVVIALPFVCVTFANMFLWGYSVFIQEKHT